MFDSFENEIKIFPAVNKIGKKIASFYLTYSNVKLEVNLYIWHVNFDIRFVKFDIYTSNLTFTRQIWQLHVKFDIYPSNLTFTSQIWYLHVKFVFYTSNFLEFSRLNLVSSSKQHSVVLTYG